MKNITLTNEWLGSFPDRARRMILRDIFKCADENGWVIRVMGGHF